MARKALIVKTKKRKLRAERQRAAGVPVTESTKVYNRCKECGRIGGYQRDFDLCRVCLRHMASEGNIMGMTKSSW